MDERQLKDMGKKVRLVISDMDGTLLNSEKRLTERTKQAIRSLSEAGKGFTICTGRISTMIDTYVRELDLRLPIVTTNGAVVWDPVAGKPLFEKAIPPDAAQRIMDYCLERKIDYSALTLGTSYFSPNSTRIEKFFIYNRIARGEGVPEMDLKYLENGHKQLAVEKLYKLLVYEAEAERYRAAGEFLRKIPDIQITSSDAGLWDISAAEVSKGTGLSFIKEYLGLDDSQICAFGDYDNDVPMLEQVGFAVAMKNGCDKIKSGAVYVADSNDDEGVALTIEQFLLERPI